MSNSTEVWTPYTLLPALEKKDGKEQGLNAIIETPKGNRNKFKYEPVHGLFMLHKVLPAGAVFPFDFGFIPRTRGQDGDPLDVLILMDEPAFTGCLVEVRLIGVIEAEQTEEGGKAERNDRLIAVAIKSQDHQSIASIKDVSQEMLDEIVHFFASYDQMEGREFRELGQKGPARANELVTQGQKLWKKAKKNGG